MPVEPIIKLTRIAPNLYSREASDATGEPVYTDADLYNFDLNKAVLKKEHVGWLKDVACDYIRRSHLNCFIWGEASRSGPHDYNVKLSFKRAFAAFHVLMEEGIDVLRVKVYGVGEAYAHLVEDARDRKVRVVLVDAPINSTCGRVKMQVNWLDPVSRHKRRGRRRIV
jgi:outer membrane protein OmpA-like peptidoglycan-associated protein